MAGASALPAIATKVCKARWLAAMRWRRGIEAALAAAGITFTEWLVLDALRELITELDDAVSQNDVARRLELNRMTVSGIMRALERKGLVSRGIDMSGRAWRVFLNAKAEVLLRETAPALEAASAV